MRRIVTRFPVGSFILLAYLTTFGLALLTRLMMDGVIPAVRWIPPLAQFGPSIAGISLTALLYGRVGLSSLLSRLKPARMGWSWAVICLALPPSLVLLAVAIHRALGGAVPAPHGSVWPDFLVATFSTAFLGAGLAEEFGWRGFGLPHLQRKHSALSSALAIGLAWALWHFPHRLLGIGPPLEALGLLSYGVAIVAMSVVFATVYNSTNGSLVAVMVLHGSNNASWTYVKQLFPDLNLGGTIRENVLVGSLWIVTAVVLVAIFRPSDLSGKPRQTA